MAGESVTRDADGRPKLDAAQLATGAESVVSGTRNEKSDPISDKEALWYLAIGAGLVGMGASPSGRSRVLSKLGKGTA